jgi:uncharacterized protein YsxB (DUF464 family)
VIEIFLYHNGYEVKGHSHIETCAEVSILTWACANTISNLGAQKAYYSSQAYAAQHGRNPNEGYTHMTFDTDNEKAMWVFQDFTHNLDVCMDLLWPKDRVVLTKLDTDLAPLEWAQA